MTLEGDWILSTLDTDPITPFARFFAASTARVMPPAQDRSMFASQTQEAAGDRACQQSSVQLRVANGTAEPSKITLKKVELLDESGAVLRELTPRDASQWANDTYQAWDEQVGPNRSAVDRECLLHLGVHPLGETSEVDEPAKVVLAPLAPRRTGS